MSLSSCFTKSLILPLLLINAAHASSVFPRGCEVSGFGYNQSTLILNESGEQSYYLIQNRSDSTIELERYNTTEEFMSPPLQATIEPTNWAAFASDVKNVNFKCYKHRFCP